MYPRHDNLDSHGRFCFLRFKATSPIPSRRLYISVVAGANKYLLSLCDAHEQEGWGTPRNEFMIRLPHVEQSEYQAAIIDLDCLTPYLGKVLTVSGFRIRMGIEVSHLGVVDDIPLWLSDHKLLSPTTAPAVSIDTPTNMEVGQVQLIKGTVRFFKLGDSSVSFQVFVQSPNSLWYPQTPVTLDRDRWSVHALFGTSEAGSGSEFTIAALICVESPANKAPARSTAPRESLPVALGRAILRVRRSQ